jgi:hypothetical protein
MRTLLALICLAAAGGCTLDKRAAKPAFPAPSQVTQLSTHSVVAGVTDPVSITDRLAIERFMATLQSIDGRWLYTWHTAPASAARVMLAAGPDQPLCFVDLGTTWVGASCGQAQPGWPPMTALTKEQARTLRDLVGGTWALPQQ